ncbi:MAG: hypothetical protein ACKPKO_44550, partial [Candidatus Fonsibacter sp.]
MSVQTVQRSQVGKPRTMTGLEQPDVDHALLHHVRMITYMLVNDSASSELLAGEGHLGCAKMNQR